MIDPLASSWKVTMVTSRGVTLCFQVSDVEFESVCTILNDPRVVHLYRGSLGFFTSEGMAEQLRHWIKNEFGLHAFIRAGGEVIGIAYEYGRRLGDQNTRMTIVIDPAKIGSGKGVQAAVLFCELIFRMLPMRWVLLEVYSFNFAVVRMLRKLDRFTSEPIHESKLKEYHYFDNRFADLHTFQIGRDLSSQLRCGILRNRPSTRSEQQFIARDGAAAL